MVSFNALFVDEIIADDNINFPNAIIVSSFKLCIFFTVFNKSVEVIAIILTVPFLATALIILSSIKIPHDNINHFLFYNVSKIFQ